MRFGDDITSGLQVLLLVPVLFLPAVFLPRAAIGATAKSLAVPSVRTVEVWPCTHTPHQQTVSSISDSTTSPSPISTTAVSLSSPQEVEQAHSFDHAHSDQSAGAVSSSRDTVVTQLDHIVAEHNTTQVVGESPVRICIPAHAVKGPILESTPCCIVDMLLAMASTCPSTVD